MGLGNFQAEEEEQTTEEGDEKVAYLYVRSDENRDAYDLMSNGFGGSALVRSVLKGHPHYEDQHDFFQQFIVALGELFENEDWSAVLEELEVPAEGLAQYLDQNEEVQEEFMEIVNSTQGAEAEADD